MKVAKNMDSVFANCTDNELEFDVFFDDDDTIIDLVAGCDEAGNLITGEDFDYESLAEASEDDLVGEKPDADYQKEGEKAKPEGSENKELEIGGEVGDKKEVTGKEDSDDKIEAQDVKDAEEAIGVNDKQQASLEASEEGPLEDDDEAERAGEVSDAAVETESSKIDAILDLLNESEVEDTPDVEDDVEGDDGTAADTSEDETCCKEENEVEVPESDHDKEVDNTDYSEGEGDAPTAESAIDALLDSLEESDVEEIEVKADNLTEEDDEAERAGEVKHDTDNIEGIKQDVPAEAEDGDNKKDPIADVCDTGARAGEVEQPKEVEGVDTKPLGAALEASEDYLDALLADLDSDDDLIDSVNNGDKVVDDSIKVDGESNQDIKLNEAAAKKKEDVADELVDDSDDVDIEAVKDEKLPDTDTSYEYELDDDQLIDAVEKGLDAVL